MQKKKDYTHEQIVEIAKREFLKNGYAKTSMRDIAKGAGIGVSNIYIYFKSKDELFRHIVMPLLHQMETMMREHHNVKNQEAFLIYATGECNEMIADHVQEYMRLINNHRDELKLLLYQSQGSSLENYIDTYTDKSSNMVLAFMDEANATILISAPSIHRSLTTFTWCGCSALSPRSSSTNFLPMKSNVPSRTTFSLSLPAGVR